MNDQVKISNYTFSQGGRESSEEMDELPISVREVAGIIPSDVDVDKVYRDHTIERCLQR